MPIEINVDHSEVDALVANLKQGPELATSLIKETLTKLATESDELFRQEIPVHRGFLRDSVQHNEPLQVGEAWNVWSGPTADHAAFVNFGTRPHFPPVDAISNWARDHGIEPWALAVSISRKGTKANAFLDRVATIMESRTEPAAQELAETFVERLLKD